jgi:hypothetical protein
MTEIRERKQSNYSGSKFLLLMLMVVFFSASISARQLDDVALPDSITIDDTNVPLQLNGMGYRTKFVFDVYVLGFYTEAKASSRDAVQALTGPKRIVMHMVRDVNREKMANALKDGFEENSSAVQLSKLNERIQTLTTYFPDLKDGDVVILDYVPAAGTRVTVNGKVKGVIDGADFYAGLLDIWLGEEPADEELKDAMLGVESDD